MLIRKYKDEDATVLVELFYHTVHTVNSADYTREQLQVWATRDIDLNKWNQSFLKNITFVAEIEDTIVGFADMDSHGYLDRLYVHKDFQNKGIATELVNHLEFTLGRNAVTSFETYASITAKPFFEKMGYVVQEENWVQRKGVQLKNFKMVKDII